MNSNQPEDSHSQLYESTARCSTLVELQIGEQELCAGASLRTFHPSPGLQQPRYDCPKRAVESAPLLPCPRALAHVVGTSSHQQHLQDGGSSWQVSRQMRCQRTAASHVRLRQIPIQTLLGNAGSINCELMQTRRRQSRLSNTTLEHASASADLELLSNSRYLLLNCFQLLSSQSMLHSSVLAKLNHLSGIAPRDGAYPNQPAPASRTVVVVAERRR
mmetsp:Transcript_24387/g.39036  ORF Transcript_24387/g.39036 Transcript_24387/m.39036 type:complete len:217 (+) Transcript_24387:247-897(+)